MADTVNCDPNALAQSARCIDCNIPGIEMKLAVLVRLMADSQDVPVDTQEDINALLQRAACINCNVPPGMLLPVLIVLLCDLVNAP